MSMIDSAIAFAATAHAEQRRKYTNEPYIFHPIEVVHILMEHGIDDEDTLVAAMLHDVVEDCPISIDTIERRFGASVAAIVYDLTEQETGGNRATRKQREAERLWTVSEKAQNIKAADLISNTISIVDHAPGFARVYLPEKREVLRGMKDVQSNLMLSAQRSLVIGMGKLMLQDLIEGK